MDNLFAERPSPWSMAERDMDPSSETSLVNPGFIITKSMDPEYKYLKIVVLPVNPLSLVWYQ